MITIPSPFVIDVLRREGEAGRRWLDSLPAQVASCCAEWGLALDGAPMHGGLSLVVPVRRGQERAVLKLVWAEADAAQEALALAAWGGRGAVRLFKADPERRALLLERLDHTHTLGTLATAEAFEIAGKLLRRLAVPAPAGVQRLADVAAELAAALPERWECAGRPMDLRLVDTACSFAGELGPGAGELLIHTDLHDANILAKERGSHDEAQPLHWLAIDPKVVAGEPAFGVAPLLWRRIDTIVEPMELASHLDTLCAAAALDPERVRAWRSSVPWTYWSALKEPAELQRWRLAATIRGRPASATGPSFPSWSELWEDIATLIRDDRRILILDELPWAIEADPALLSALQYAWDIHFQHSNLILVLCGSHIRTMESLLSRQTPLFGRLTAQYQLQPLPFGVLREFFPTWAPDAQVAAYAILGGVPQYLTWFEADASLSENIRRNILGPTSVALSEIELLLSDEVRDIRTYLTVLNAIGEGAHALKEISDATVTAPTNLTKYLGVLQELRLVERRVPAIVPSNLQHRSKQGRYHLLDPFHRFYFRFLRPNQAEIAYQPDRILEQIQSGLRAFVGQTAWEELARSWVFHQGLRGALGFAPEVIGSHWDRSVQADVVAVSWRERVMLVGECKWGADAVTRQELRRLIEHTLPRTLAALPQRGEGWRAIPALFARAGATPDAGALLHEQGGLLVDLPTLYADLAP